MCAAAAYSVLVRTLNATENWCLSCVVDLHRVFIQEFAFEDSD